MISYLMVGYHISISLARRVRIGCSGGANEPTSVGGPLLPLSNDQYAIFAPDVEAVTVEMLAWVPRSSKRQYILHLKNLPFYILCTFTNVFQ